MLHFPLGTFEQAAALFPAVEFPTIINAVEAANGEGRLTFTDGVYASIEAYAPKQESRFESHRIFADIQIVLEGSEYIDVCPVSALGNAPYDGARDISFYGDPHEDSRTAENGTAMLSAGEHRQSPVRHIRMTPGSALLLLPEDAHKPCLFDGAWTGIIRKCVIKIPMALQKG